MARAEVGYFSLCLSSLRLQLDQLFEGAGGEPLIELIDELSRFSGEEQRRIISLVLSALRGEALRSVEAVENSSVECGNEKKELPVEGAEELFDSICEELLSFGQKDVEVSKKDDLVWRQLSSDLMKSLVRRHSSSDKFASLRVIDGGRLSNKVDETN